MVKTVRVLFITILVTFLFSCGGDTSSFITWIRTYAGPELGTAYAGHKQARAYYVRQTNDGGFIATGDAGIDRKYIYLLKTDSLGNIQWERTFSSRYANYGASVQPTSDGGYLICGGTYDDALDQKILVIKTDTGGNIAWETELGGPYINYCSEALQTGDGGYIIAGFNDDRTDDLQSVDAYMAKLDAEGQLIWQRFLGEKETNESAASVAIAADGRFVMVGTSQLLVPTGDRVSSVYVVKATPSGDIV